MIKIDFAIHVNYTLFLSDFNQTSIFSIGLRKTPKYQILLISVKWKPSRSIMSDRSTAGQTDKVNNISKKKIQFNISVIQLLRKISGNYRQKTFPDIVIFLEANTFHTTLTTTQIALI